MDSELGSGGCWDVISCERWLGSSSSLSTEALVLLVLLSSHLFSLRSAVTGLTFTTLQGLYHSCTHYYWLCFSLCRIRTSVLQLEIGFAEKGSQRLRERLDEFYLSSRGLGGVRSYRNRSVRSETLHKSVLRWLLWRLGFLFPEPRLQEVPLGFTARASSQSTFKLKLLSLFVSTQSFSQSQRTSEPRRSP